jgi:transcriptional regulator NrdR family protein
MDVKCPVCEGSAVVYVDERDDYEGNKCRRIAYCEFCDAKGKFSDVTDKGKAVREYWNTLNALEAKRELRQSALEKLTDEEKEALGL